EFGHTSRVPVRRPDFSPVERQWNGGVPPKAGRGRGPKGRKRSALVPLEPEARGEGPCRRGFVPLSRRRGGEGPCRRGFVPLSRRRGGKVPAAVAKRRREVGGSRSHQRSRSRAITTRGRRWCR